MAKYGLTPDFLKSQIRNVTFNRFSRTGIQCVLTLLNSYTVTGESSCIDPFAFDQSVGEKIAYENAFDKLWAILSDRIALAHRNMQQQTETTEV